ncbi:MAG TPA: dTDP-4-dehydrorhamnose 3,5-epimerase [Nitrospirota bacterium]
MPFEFIQTALPGVLLVRPKVFGDERGFFLELYKHTDFVRGGIPEHLVQDNLSRSARGVLRGLHYQKDPHAQGKLVICLRGKIFDVAVDIRAGSPRYGQWVGMDLTEENRQMLYVPPGFAHGFQVKSDSAEVLYKCTGEYSPADDRGIIWNDPDINISWPLGDPVLSGKDREHPRLRDADNNFRMPNAS